MLGRHVTALRLIRGTLVFKQANRPRLHASHEKPDDERAIEVNAHDAIEKSRKQIDRARNILEGEVRRLDQILARGK